MTYKSHGGGLLTLIHNKHTFISNFSKFSTHANISSFSIQSTQCVFGHKLKFRLQERTQNTTNLGEPTQPKWRSRNRIHIMNQPINLSIPSCEDLPLVSIIQSTIDIHLDHPYMFCREFNCDIALIGRTNTTTSQRLPMENFHGQPRTKLHSYKLFKTMRTQLHLKHHN